MARKSDSCRSRYESRQTANFHKLRLDQLRELKDEFSAPLRTALYHLWREFGETTVRSRVASNSGAPSNRIRAFAPFL